MRRNNSITLDDIRKSAVAGLNTHLFESAGMSAAKTHKYHAKKTEVNGIVFDSRKEAKRYKELLLLLKSGHIGMLQLQVPYELNPGGTHSLKYVADFQYLDSKTGETIIEDVKGYRTAEYRKKKRLMLQVHGITIKEV